MLADECHKQGIKLFFYYSQLDWHHPDYFPRGRTGQDSGRPDHGDWSRYLDYMDGQLKELLTGYGEIGGIWFDGWWDKPDADWRLDRTYKLIHDLQPAALIGSNHHRKPFPGEDFQMFEKDLPGTQHRGIQRQVRDRRAAPRDVRHHEQRLGLQPERHAVQEHEAARAAPGEGGRVRRQPAAEHRPAPGRHDPARVRGPASRRSGTGWPRTASRSTARAAVPSRPAPGASPRTKATTCSSTSSIGRTPCCRCLVLSAPSSRTNFQRAAVAGPRSPSRRTLSLKLDPSAFDAIDTILVVQLGR